MTHKQSTGTRVRVRGVVRRSTALPASVAKAVLIATISTLLATFTGCATRSAAYVPAPISPPVLPADHNYHANRFEWIYYSGIVETTEDRELGVMFTIFQMRPSSTATRLLAAGNGGSAYYPVLIAVSDPTGGIHRAEFTVPTRVRIDQVDGLPALRTHGIGLTISPDEQMSISCDCRDLQFDLTLRATREPLLHGEDGVIEMGDGNDSGYFMNFGLSCIELFLKPVIKANFFKFFKFIISNILI